jgi:starch synthase
MSLRVVFAASEVHPVVKTGGLADVASGLPPALARLGVDVRVALPAYRHWRERVGAPRRVAGVRAQGRAFTVWEATVEHGPPLWLLDCPELFDRPGTPYEDEHHRPWPDNGIRFGLFAQALAQLAADGAADFRPDVLHANDWHTGLALPWLRERAARPGTLFTIHNLAYQGVFPAAEAAALGLPPAWWHLEGVEFHGELSHLKAGIACADAISTVSPSYAREIQHPAHGFGLDGLLRARSAALHGILNGIDERAWDPARDPALVARYDAATVEDGKAACKLALQRELGLDHGRPSLLVAMVARFTHQKGTDLLLEAAPQLDDLPLQFAILGRGEPALQHALERWAAAHPGRVALRIGHDEACAHRIFAGADAFLMPSRYEPCGLTQMYAQRYGTVPVVRRTGGLADTVTDATPATLRDGTATGVHFEHADAGGVAWGLRRAAALHGDPPHWRALQRAGMARDFSWRHVAGDYLALYRRLAAARGGGDAAQPVPI